MTEFQSKGRQSTRERYQRAMEFHPFYKLRSKKILETTADELRFYLSDGKPSTNHFLRWLHNLAVGMGWLPWPLIPAKLWPMVRSRKRRGISAAEHRLIIDAETNEERRNFYQLLWEIGAAQNEAALLSAENIKDSTPIQTNKISLHSASGKRLRGGRQRRSAEEMARLGAEYQGSGCSLGDFAQEHGVHWTTVRRWVSRIPLGNCRGVGRMGQ